MTNQDKIVDRIKKLLALAGNNPNPNEAKIAMERANKLLKDNDLSMSSILDVETEEVGKSIGKNVQVWTRRIYNSVANLYHCSYYVGSTINQITRKVRNKKHNIVGSESNRVTTMLICSYIIKAINKESKLYSNATMFKNGASIAIIDMVSDLIKAEENDKTEVIVGTGLVPMDIKLIRTKANDDFLSGAKIGTIGNRKTRASRDGYDYGSSLSVNPQLNGSQVALK